MLDREALKELERPFILALLDQWKLPEGKHFALTVSAWADRVEEAGADPEYVHEIRRMGRRPIYVDESTSPLAAFRVVTMTFASRDNLQLVIEMKLPRERGDIELLEWTTQVNANPGDQPEEEVDALTFIQVWERSLCIRDVAESFDMTVEDAQNTAGRFRNEGIRLKEFGR
jgi:hypothetical protein